MSANQSVLRFFDGLTRFAKERYCVHVMDRSQGRTRIVPGPLWSYYADPFLVEEASGYWLFVEEMHYPTCRGYITAIPLDKSLATGTPKRVLPLACHASFPFVFTHQEILYMVPETSHARVLDLFACECLPDKWRLARRLMSGVDCADTILHYHKGLWYVITSQRHDHGDAGRSLAIYYAESLFPRRWQPHPINRERRYADRTHGYGRNGGALIEDGERLLRPMQASEDYYGQSVRVMQITRLSEGEYEEVPFSADHEFNRIAVRYSTHHISRAGNVVAWDSRTRVAYAARSARKRTLDAKGVDPLQRGGR